MSIFNNSFDFRKEGIVPGAIIVASIIISGSVIVSANKIANVFTNPAGPNDGSQVQVVQGGGEKVELTNRRDAPTIGRGELEIVEFSDFQCPFCQQFFNNAYKEIIAKYVDTGKAKFVYRHYPLPFHQNAQIAAEAAECANAQGKFKAYHDTLFTNLTPDGGGLAREDLKRYAQNLGLNTSDFNSCLDGGKMKEKVAADMKAAQEAGISGTPTFIINGRKLVGAQPFVEFQKIIEQELK